MLAFSFNSYLLTYIIRYHHIIISHIQHFLIFNTTSQLSIFLFSRVKKHSCNNSNMYAFIFSNIQQVEMKNTTNILIIITLTDISYWFLLCAVAVVLFLRFQVLKYFTYLSLVGNNYSHSRDEYMDSRLSAFQLPFQFYDMTTYRPLPSYTSKPSASFCIVFFKKS